MGNISTHELAKYAVDQIESGASVSFLSEQLAAYLIEERRSRDMPALMRAIDKEFSLRGSNQVVVTSVHSTTAEIKNQLAKLLEVDNPVFSEVIDKSVIGGVKARSGETEVDLTVRGRLNRFKSNIVSQEN